MSAGWLPRPLSQSASLRELAAVSAVPDASAELVQRCARALIAEGCADEARAIVFVVPGRIEVLGKHTDYAGGRSLVCTVDRGFVLVAVPRDDCRLLALDAAGGTRADLIIDESLPAAPGHWSDYVRTPARRMARNFDRVTGADVAFVSDLPQAAGLSSSSALVIGMFLVLGAAAQIQEDPRYAEAIRTPEDLAGYLAAVENGLDFRTLSADSGVGTLGGSQDHTAILCCTAGALSRFSFLPVRAEGVAPLSEEWTFAVASSGVRAEKSAAALASYNNLSALASDAARVWHTHSGSAGAHLGAVLELGEADALLELLRAQGSHELRTRATQFFEEAGVLVPAAFDALLARDITTFGRIVARSHHLADTHLGNQIPETNALVQLAGEHGAVAASAFGAGFGGSVWALARTAEITDFLQRWETAYLERFPQHEQAAAFFSARPGPPARRLF